MTNHVMARFATFIPTERALSEVPQDFPMRKKEICSHVRIVEKNSLCYNLAIPRFRPCESRELRR